MNPKVMICFGTRPEIIKVSSVIQELQRRSLPFVTVFTGQHRELFEDVKQLVPEPDYHLGIMRPEQELNDIVSRLADKFVPVLRKTRPDLVIVQGDTTTAALCSLLAFYDKIPVGHIEAGLRTYDLTSPFPEEGNRQMISRLAGYNWAPTEQAVQFLRAEKARHIFLTGNTVVDACRAFKLPIKYTNEILVTLHRRENFGEKMAAQFDQLEWLARKHPDLKFIFPMHPNPKVQKLRDRIPHVAVINPLPYPAMIAHLSRARFVISDSGGLQEECATFGKKILVCRNKTERPEGILAGFARLADDRLVDNFSWANDSPRWTGTNPYGDGTAGKKIVDTLSL